MEQQTTDSSAFVVSKTRLEMLFDGIFAIAMTILVLELKVPELADRNRSRSWRRHWATMPRPSSATF